MNRFVIVLASTFTLLPGAIAPAAEQVLEAPVVNERLRSGVHLGGIGAGKIELLTDGALASFTGNGNWDRPVRELPSARFLVRARERGGREELLALASGDPFGVSSVRTIRFQGRFPHAEIEFEDPRLPCRIRLEAFSPFVPGDLESSTVPGALFRFTIRPQTGEGRRPELEALEILLGFEGLAGVGGTIDDDFTDRTGAFAIPRRDGAVAGVSFGTERLAEGPARNTLGTQAIAARIDSGLTVETPGLFDALSGAEDGGELARYLRADAPLRPFENRGVEGSFHPASLIVVRADPEPLAARTATRIDLAIAWHAPHLVTERDSIDHGRAYGERFDDAFAVAKHLLENTESLESRTLELPRFLRRSSLPEWLVDKLLNNLGPLVSSTVLTRDGWFACLESPVTMAGALGTIDQRLASHAAYTFLFPELDRRELETFARLQMPTGQIPHFCGNVHEQLETIAVAYGFTGWPDLACSFVLQVDSHTRWTGERAFLERMKPHVARAWQWLHLKDKDGDGIPEGGSTFDNRHYDGAFIYIASVYLAALLAGERIARNTGDDELADACRSRFARAQASMVEQLWNGRWFEKSFDPKTGARTRSCFFAQLAGEFRARLQGLGPTVPDAMARTALESILALNVGRAPHLVATDVEPGGLESDNPDVWAQYTEIFLLLHAIQQGRTDEAFDVLESMQRDYRFSDRSPFDIALVYDLYSGRRKWGESYMTTPGSFFLPRVLLGFDIDKLDLEERGGATLVLDPRPPAPWDRFRLPIHSPGLVLMVDVDLGGSTSHRRFRIDAEPGTEPTPIREVILGLPAGVAIDDAFLYLPERRAIVAAEPVTTHPTAGRFRLDEPLWLARDRAVELYLVSRDSGSVSRTDAGDIGVHGASVRRTGDTPTTWIMESERDTDWPLLLRVDPNARTIVPDPSTWTALPPRDGVATSREYVALAPGQPLGAATDRYLSALPAPLERQCQELRTSDETSRRWELARDDLAIRADPTREAVRSTLTRLRAEVDLERARAAEALDLDRASELAAVAIDLAFRGNPLVDERLRVQLTISCADARVALDELRFEPPPGVLMAETPPAPAGRVLAPGEVFQMNAQLLVTPEARWRRQLFSVELTGRRLDIPPVAFERRETLSIGYDFVRGFLVAGPFVAPDGDHLRAAFGPERDAELAPDAVFRGEGPRDVAWTPSQTVYQGILSFRSLLDAGVTEGGVYAMVDLVAERDTEARALIGAAGKGVKVWLDGRPIFAHEEPGVAAPGQHAVDLLLKRGHNRLLVKTAGKLLGLGLLLEIVDRDGRSLDHVSAELPTQGRSQPR